MRFQIGDKVAVYFSSGRRVARVEEIDGENMYVREAINEEAPYPYYVHQKQCRRIRAKTKRIRRKR